MIVSTAELLTMPEFQGVNASQLERKLRAIETQIRSLTNNNFQVRTVRVYAPSEKGGLVISSSPFLPGDTVEIGESVNEGLYVVEHLSPLLIFDRPLKDSEHNMATLIKYPDDVVDGALSMLVWQYQYGEKVGVKSETLSRHHVTYFDMDSTNSSRGYPISLLGFLKPYTKARF